MREENRRTAGGKRAQDRYSLPWTISGVVGTGAAVGLFFMWRAVLPWWKDLPELIARATGFPGFPVRLLTVLVYSVFVGVPACGAVMVTGWAIDRAMEARKRVRDA